jgi:hypothetical protein
VTTTAELFAETTDEPKNGSVLLEAGRIQEATVQPSGKGGFVVVDLIREGFGNKRDGHYYSADVLKEAADQFVNAQMFENHLDPETEKKLGGLPRKPSELLGRIRETWIDKDDDGNTVIRGKASVSQPWAWNMIEHDPELLGVSINARGRSRVGMVEGQEAKIVEGISSVRSVDWVTKAGAGGKVVALMEAQIQEEEEAAEERTDSEETPDEAPAAPEGEESPDKPEEEPQGEEEAQSETCAECGAEAHGRFCSECGAELVEAEGEEPEAEEPEPEGEKPDGEEEPEGEEAAEGLWDVLDEGGELPDRDELRERIAWAIEHRAGELAEAQLDEAVRAAVAVAVQEFEAEKEAALRENDAMWSRKLGRVTQGAIARSMIDTSGLPEGSKTALREQFHDCFYEEVKDGDEIVKDAETVCREAVQKALDAKRAEVQQIAESGGSPDGGATDSGGRLQEAATGDRPAPSRGRVPTKAPLDAQLDRRLGIEGSPKAA